MRTFLYTLPLAIIGILWLIRSTDLELIQQQFLFFLFNFGLLFLFNRLSFFTIIEIRSDRYGSSEDSLASMIQWSVIFLLGPTALWLSVIYSFIDFALDWRVSSTQGQRWSLLRTLSTNLTVNTFAILVSLAIYKNVGGEFPKQGLTITSVTQALIALIRHFFLVLIIVSGYLIYHIGVQRILAQSQTVQSLVRFFLISVGLPYLAHPFSILLAGLLIEDGFVIYAFLLAGLVLVVISPDD